MGRIMAGKQPCVAGLTAVAVLSVSCISVVQAQDYPAKSITVVNGYAAGAGPDVPIRYFAEKLRELSGKPVIVENRPGALTNIAAEAVARAKPDGYTVFITAGNSTMAANPYLFRKLPYDPQKDFTPVTTLYQTAFVLVVNSKMPVKSLAELTAYLKQKKDRASYGYSGSLGLATAELYKSMAGLDTPGISYKSLQQSIPDVLSGALDFIFQDAAVIREQTRAGQFRALAVTPQRRTAVMPDVPTMSEAGFPGYDLSGWFAAYLPANAPAAIVERLSGLLNQIVANDETNKFLTGNGLDPMPGSPQKLAQFQSAELEKWGRILKAARVEPQ
jgi:tripartite-type tricarboxylate transporter receptor subunit TctC